MSDLYRVELSWSWTVRFSIFSFLRMRVSWEWEESFPSYFLFYNTDYGLLYFCDVMFMFGSAHGYVTTTDSLRFWELGFFDKYAIAIAVVSMSIHSRLGGSVMPVVHYFGFGRAKASSSSLSSSSSSSSWSATQQRTVNQTNTQHITQHNIQKYRKSKIQKCLKKRGKCTKLKLAKLWL